MLKYSSSLKSFSTKNITISLSTPLFTSIMKNIILILVSLTWFSCSQNNTSDSTTESAAETPAGGVSFLSLEDNAEISSPFLLEMGVEGMTVEPKGQPRAGFGHHHLLINDGHIKEGYVIVADSTHIHYGGGQTSDSIALAPGDYQLTLQFADGMHVSYGEQWSQTISVTVK